MSKPVKVGDYLGEVPRSYPEGTTFYYQNQQPLVLVLKLSKPTPGEAEAVAKGDCEFAAIELDGVLFLVFRFGATIKWSSAALAVETKSAPTDIHRLDIILVNADDGKIVALRVVGLAPGISQFIGAAIERQIALRWSPREFEAHVLVLQEQHRDEELAQMAPFKTHIKAKQ